MCMLQASTAAVHSWAGGATEALPMSGGRETKRRESRAELRRGETGCPQDAGELGSYTKTTSAVS